MRKKKFNHQPGKDYCEQIGLPYWDEEFANACDILARQHGLDQKAWDEMVRQYSWKVKLMFTPKTYTYWQRIKFAVHFLNPFSKGL